MGSWRGVGETKGVRVAPGTAVGSGFDFRHRFLRRRLKTNEFIDLFFNLFLSNAEAARCSLLPNDHILDHDFKDGAAQLVGILNFRQPTAQGLLAGELVDI